MIIIWNLYLDFYTKNNVYAKSLVYSIDDKYYTFFAKRVFSLVFILICTTSCLYYLKSKKQIFDFYFNAFISFS